MFLSNGIVQKLLLKGSENWTVVSFFIQKCFDKHIKLTVLSLLEAMKYEY